MPSPSPKERLTPWRDPLREPGPTIMFDIDGVVATMRWFEDLLGDSSRNSNWTEFHRRFGQASVLARGARLVQDAKAAELEVAWSTTRPDQYAPTTWRWLARNRFPAGPVEFRHFIKDGPRDAMDIKLRHWWTWDLKYQSRNPLIAWVDDDPKALNVLRGNGCPAWGTKQLERAIRSSRPLLEILREGPPNMSPEKLERNREEQFPLWQEREARYQQIRSEWFEGERRRAQARRREGR